MVKRKRLIRYRAVKVVGRDIKIEFFDKKGNQVFIQAVQNVPLDELTGKELLRWLRKNKFKYLAQALKKVIEFANES